MSEHAYCPGCNRTIRLEAPPEHRDGHANLPEGTDLVCLDFGVGCTDGKCPITGTAGIVMGVRLARSHLEDDKFPRVTGRCSACGNVGELEVLDSDYVFCPLCETTSRWTLLDVDERTRIALTLG